MARLTEALTTYRPRVRQGPVVELEALVERASARVPMRHSQVQMVLSELVEEIGRCLERGEQPRLPGIGLFRAEARLDGSMRPAVTLDRALKWRVTSTKRFRGQLINRKQVGMDAEAIRALWNAEHPEDPIVD